MSPLILTIAILIVDKVNAKGGGGHASSHGSSSSGSSSKSSSSKSGSSKSGSAKGGSTDTETTSGVSKSVVIVGGGDHVIQCHDSVTNQIVPCPVNRRRNTIIIAVIIGAVFVGLIAWFFIRRRRRNQRQLADKTVNLPFEISSKKEYQRLEDPA